MAVSVRQRTDKRVENGNEYSASDALWFLIELIYRQWANLLKRINVELGIVPCIT